MEDEVRQSTILGALLFFVLGLFPLCGQARPKQGDATIGISATHLGLSNGTVNRCNSDGDDCEETAEYTDLNIGIGCSGGYLLTDLFEAGVGFAVYGSSHDRDYRSGSRVETNSTRLYGEFYGKLNLGSDETIVPFLRGWSGLSLWSSEYKDQDPNSGDTYENKRSEVTIRIYSNAGLDYYLAEHYALSGYLFLGLEADWIDPQADDDDSGLFRETRRDIGIGFGLSTYF
jgi:hypothetical protein